MLEMAEARVVVAHIHLFKNAGTSVENSLGAFFQDRWESYDKESSADQLCRDELVAYLRQRPELQAISSHHLRPPLQNTLDLEIMPIVFVRHPIDRIRSAYEFEKVQGPVSASSRAASTMNMAEWIEFHQNRRSTQCRNFQTYALTSLRNDVGAPVYSQPIDRHLERAIDFLSSLPALGLVESFDETWQWISSWIRTRFPSFHSEPRRENRTSRSAETLQARLDHTREQLGVQAYDQLLECNQADLRLHRWATDRFEQAARTS